jgi:hypothetical protein
VVVLRGMGQSAKIAKAGPDSSHWMLLVRSPETVELTACSCHRAVQPPVAKKLVNAPLLLEFEVVVSRRSFLVPVQTDV